ncbi:protein LDOC1-like [Erythrolamprus reginae]|uniref:protein LDOC1-like n=1 Tax=Erythrolamprus reginae TaxID=121349 RepID=UPI00396CD3D8
MAEVQAVFEALHQEIQALMQMMADLQNQMMQLTQQLAPLVQQLVQAPLPMPCRKCFVAVSERFLGDHCQFPAFLSQKKNGCMEKVAFLCSLPASPAAVWVLPLLDSNDPLLQDYAAFCNQLWWQYVEPVWE